MKFAPVMILVSAALHFAVAALPKPADLPRQASLPDPLMMLDGRRVTTREMWFTERRPELIRLFQYYMYGQLPPKPAALSSKVERSDPAAFGRKATLSEVTVKFDRPEAPSIHLMLVVPNSRTKRAPLVLAINYFGNHTLVRDEKVRLADNWGGRNYVKFVPGSYQMEWLHAETGRYFQKGRIALIDGSTVGPRPGSLRRR